nr:hypothetical protein [Tanacetum cinerariifolium]
IIMANLPPPNNDSNVPEDDQAPTAPDGHGVLTRKMEEVSDAEVANGIAIKEIHPRVATVEEQVQTLQTALHGAELQNQ